MSQNEPFEIFMVAAPGLEDMLLAEAVERGFTGAARVQGGVQFDGHWPDVWRANLEMRGATRVLARFGSFMAFHLAQLDKRARKFPWGEVLRPDVPVKVEVTTSKASKIYHAGAAAQRIETALKESHAITVSPDASVVIKARIDDNRVTLSIDTSGESLHKRGHKEAVGKAPMRETLASLFLRKCGFDGAEPLVDPMCGSGTFVIEAAEIAAGLQAGRSRSFAFQQLASFDTDAWAGMLRPVAVGGAVQCHGFDRDAGAVRMATGNSERAGVADLTAFTMQPFSDLTPPEGPKGLVMINPPYGARIGNKKLLYGLYAAMGEVLMARFSGWRVGIVTSEPSLAKSTGLPFLPQGASVPHGGLKVTLYQTDALR
ncbi:MAG: THUMP domain-containing class I SAM-dependent RNA methyltransferase [Paracoccaceae bacterium]